jgi:tRNA U55 pseudouridine synthase TruB
LIRRTAAGRFTVSEACALDDVEKKGTQAVLSMRDAFSTIPFVTCPDGQVASISHGNDVRLAGDFNPDQDGLAFACDQTGEILALLHDAGNGTFHPVRVFGSSG